MSYAEDLDAARAEFISNNISPGRKTIKNKLQYHHGNNPKDFPYLSSYTIIPEESCIDCKDSIKTGIVFIEHLCSAKHIANKHGVSEYDVGRAYYALRLIRETENNF